MALIILLAGILVLPKEPISRVVDRRIDFVGIVTFTYGVVAIIYYLSEAPYHGWSTAETLAPFLGGIVLLGVFVVVECKIAYPVMPFHIFWSRRLMASCVTILLTAAAMSGMIYFSVLLFEIVLQYKPLMTAVATLPLSLGAIVGIGIEMVLMNKVPTKLMTIVGWFLVIVSNIWWAQITVTSSYWAVAMPAFILAGFGITACWICSQINVVADVADEDQGLVASGKKKMFSSATVF